MRSEQSSAESGVLRPRTWTIGEGGEERKKDELCLVLVKGEDGDSVARIADRVVLTTELAAMQSRTRTLGEGAGCITAMGETKVVAGSRALRAVGELTALTSAVFATKGRVGNGAFATTTRKLTSRSSAMARAVLG